MKRLILPLMLLLVTGCASVRTHKEADTLAFPAHRDIPVFMAFGPNLVGYETIVVTSLNDFNIPLGAKVACNFIAPDRDVILLEGVMLSKDPILLLEYPPGSNAFASE